MNNEAIVPVVLCGGSGSRLWPLSRASYPKQYLSIRSEETISFLQQTAKRINKFKNIKNPILICNEDHRFIVAEQMRRVEIKPDSILLEPCGRNTAPAITLSAIKSLQNNYDPILIVLPSDHIIREEEKFLDVIKSSLKYARNNKLVTLGIVPNKAETSFGYIEAENILSDKKLKGENIKKFIEKPNLETARKLVLDKRFSWNSGMFIFKASVFIEEIKKFSPDIYNICKKSLDKNLLDLEFQRVDKEIFSLCKNISIDKAIMEKTNNGIVLPLNVGWNDIGSWESMWEIADKDNNGNVVSGKVELENVKNSYLRGEERTIVGIGIKNLVIVETIDAILVANKNETQYVKNIVEKLLSENKSEASTHKTIFRPWGNYTSIAESSNWQVKKIIVNPGQSLSLQLHNHRTEHWIIVSGKALVQIGQKEEVLTKNQSTYIPLATKHRLSNPSNEVLILIEVQSGDYLGEDDIIRFQDNYGRLI